MIGSPMCAPFPCRPQRHHPWTSPYSLYSLLACLPLQRAPKPPCRRQLTAWHGGSDRANRPAPELEALIGYFINPVALRTQLHGGLSFQQVVSRVRDTVVGAQGHAEVEPCLCDECILRGQFAI